MYKPKLTLLQQEILRFLFIHAGEAFNARGLSIALGVSQPAISKALPFLGKQEFITVSKDKTSKRFSIQLNRENRLVIGMKRAENLKMIYESGLFEFLFNEFPGCTIVLFGSYSRGEDIWIGENRSDIDIAVIGTKAKELDLSRFNRLLERKIIINYYDYWKNIHSHLKINILNGILLKGSAES